MDLQRNSSKILIFGFWIFCIFFTLKFSTQIISIYSLKSIRFHLKKNVTTILEFRPLLFSHNLIPSSVFLQRKNKYDKKLIEILNENNHNSDFEKYVIFETFLVDIFLKNQNNCQYIKDEDFYQPIDYGISFSTNTNNEIINKINKGIFLLNRKKSLEIRQEEFINKKTIFCKKNKEEKSFFQFMTYFFISTIVVAILSKFFLNANFGINSVEKLKKFKIIAKNTLKTEKTLIEIKLEKFIKNSLNEIEENIKYKVEELEEKSIKFYEILNEMENEEENEDQEEEKENNEKIENNSI